jgi:catechol 2,3-dioxygenase-like lactoylglutathione lyase family enzyme
MPDPAILAKHCGALAVEFRPAEGGRLAHLRHDGVDLVLPQGRVPGYYGDTFWPSPQSRFEWPPPPVLDSDPYEIVAETPLGLTMLSAPDRDQGLQVRKSFALSEHGVTMEFTLTNTLARPQAVAPWQVTRAPREGLIVWAAGDPFDDADRVQKQAEDPGSFYLHSASVDPFEGLAGDDEYASIAVPSVTRTSKFFTDARGWVAHVHHSILFLRVFPDLTPAQAAPRQGELELFFGIERDYIELENQGAYQALDPGHGLTYPVEWRISTLDPAVPNDRVTPELLAEIQAQLAPANP